MTLMRMLRSHHPVCFLVYMDYTYAMICLRGGGTCLDQMSNDFLIIICKRKGKIVGDPWGNVKSNSNFLTGFSFYRRFILKTVNQSL